MSFRRILVVTAVAAVLAVGAAAASASAQQADGYAGAHLSFDTTDNAVVDYQVDGVELFSSAEVEARTDAEERGAGGVGVGVGAGVDLGAVSGIAGANIEATAEARTSANVEFQGSASLSAHDNSNAVLVLEAGGEEQLVEVEVPADAEAEARSDVVVSTEKDGVEGSYIVVGDGEAAVNDEGDVTAHLGEDARMVFRAHTEGASEDDEEQERIIADGNAAAEVQFVGDHEEVDGAAYLDDVENVEGENPGEDRVEVEVSRVEADGKVVLTTVSEAAVGASEAFDVEVDGEAAVEVDSYSELEAAAEGDSPAYKVVGETSAESHAQVLVALDHFSERSFTVASADEEDDEDAEADDDGEADDVDDEETDDEEVDDEEVDDADEEDEAVDDEDEGLPGFTVVAALLAVTLFAMRRR